MPTRRLAKANERPAPRIRRTVATTIRPSPAASITIGKPPGSIGFGFKTCAAVSAAARPSAPSQAPQTVSTHGASIGRLWNTRLRGPTFDSDYSNVSPVAVKQAGPCGRSRGDDETASLTKVEGSVNRIRPKRSRANVHCRAACIECCSVHRYRAPEAGATDGSRAATPRSGQQGVDLGPEHPPGAALGFGELRQGACIADAGQVGVGLPVLEPLLDQ